jgi:plasmid maintenance system antidote protein VapI
MKSATTFQDQLRAAVEQSGKSHGEICREARIQKATFSRFVNGKGGLSIEAIDRLTDCIGLRVTLKGK